ncbi:HTH-type transcriptional regulator YesS [Oxobacter pfennigii]|uniref:HTH-type transcriptional regulator YesS n=1 Tax=Oxobacter pfennigii TaxID=36849 RepID=A0A0N8NT50_9CLOT|nr:helix-turn-helix domain-containing protein [Oxobacter pfennigii]KPU43848.1 HTH-type transcriptional regulator YesS [Oxobacter pfennigii]
MNKSVSGQNRTGTSSYVPDNFPSESLKNLKNAMELYRDLTEVDYSIFFELPVEDNAYDDFSNVKNDFCSYTCLSKEGSSKCRNQILKAGRQALDLGQPYVFVCYGGLVEWAVPIIQGKNYIGTAAAGRIRMEKADDEAREEMEEQFKSLGLDGDHGWKLYKELPYMTPHKVNKASSLLFAIICFQMESDKDLLENQKKLWAKRASFAETILEQKRARELALKPYLYISTDSGTAGNRQYSIFTDDEGSLTKESQLIKQEKELIGRIRLGDRSAAKKIINEILGDIFLNTGEDLSLTKARLLELLTSVGRAAIQRDAPGEVLFSLYQDAVSSLQDAGTFEDIYPLTADLFDRLMNTIYQSRDKDKYAPVLKALEYLKQHYAGDININHAANSVHLSPHYLSRLFKEELGITIIEYLTEIRLEAAKDLLVNTGLTINEVAGQVGYQDITYFSRLFKKRQGISPGEYRRWWKTAKNIK